MRTKGKETRERESYYTSFSQTDRQTDRHRKTDNQRQIVDDIQTSKNKDSSRMYKTCPQLVQEEKFKYHPIKVTTISHSPVNHNKHTSITVLNHLF